MRKDWKVSVLVNYEASSCLRRLDVGFPAASMRWCGLSKGQKVLCHREGVVIRLHVEFRNIIGQKASALLLVCICVGFGSESGPYFIDDFFDQSPSSPLGNFRQDHRMRITGGKHTPPVLSDLDSRYRITQSIRGTNSYENLKVTMGRQGLDSYKEHPSLNATVPQVYKRLFQCICEDDIELMYCISENFYPRCPT